MSEAALYQVYRETESSAGKPPHYVQTYRCVLDGMTIFRLDYCSSMNTVQPCELRDGDDHRLLTLSSASGFGRNQVVLTKKGQVIATVEGGKVLDADGHLVAQASDVESTGKAMLRTTTGGATEHYRFVDEAGEVLAEMQDVRPKRRLPWPLSIVEAIVRLFLQGPATPRYTVDVTGPKVDEIDIAVLFVTTVILDNLRGSTAS